MTHHEPGEEYAGPAPWYRRPATRLEVEADLRGRFDPIDGRFHWYGRLAASPTSTRSAPERPSRSRPSTARAEGGSATSTPGVGSRVSGVGPPPF